MKKTSNESLERLHSRRQIIKQAAAGAAVVALGGGLYRLASDDLTREARAQTRSDGLRRLPPGQRVIKALKPMGGSAGSPRVADFSLKVHGEVESPYTLDWRELLAMKQVELKADVHCVTGWSLLGSTWTGVRVKDLAARARPLPSARHVIFEAAHGYTANVPLRSALKPNVMITHRINGKPLAKRHGFPARSLVPDLYFWKSAKWITGIRFVRKDRPGYWEVRGYHNRANPWREERHS